MGCDFNICWRKMRMNSGKINLRINCKTKSNALIISFWPPNEQQEILYFNFTFWHFMFCFCFSLLVSDEKIQLDQHEQNKKQNLAVKLFIPASSTMMLLSQQPRLSFLEDLSPVVLCGEGITRQNVVSEQKRVKTEHPEPPRTPTRRTRSVNEDCQSRYLWVITCEPTPVTAD